MWSAVVLAYALVIFAYALPQDFRDRNEAYLWATWVAFMVRTFSLHIGLVLLIIAGVGLRKRMRRVALAAAPLAIFVMGPTLYDARPKSPPPIDGPSFKLLSMNLLYTNRHFDEILAEIRRVNPDVLFLQEYSSDWYIALSAALSQEYKYNAESVYDNPFGQAIFSRIPFEGKPEYLRIGYVETPQQRIVIKLGGRPIALYNIHLVPPHAIHVMGERRLQFAELLDHLDHDPLPTLISGDFNLTNTSAQAAALMQRGYRDVSQIDGWGLCDTWTVRGLWRYVPIPGVRIDHIYLSPKLTAHDAATGAGSGSDHRPVMAEIGLMKTGP